MPKYGLHRYGTFQYGHYQLVGGGGQSLGPHVRYRIRMIDHDGKKSPMLMLHRDRLAMPGDVTQSRIRANGGDWARTQNATIEDRTPKVRIRSIHSTGSFSDWVLGERGNLTNP